MYKSSTDQILLWPRVQEMASIEESRAVVAGLTQELMEKNLLLEKFDRALQSVEFSIGEYADKRLPRYFIPSPFLNFAS